MYVHGSGAIGKVRRCYYLSAKDSSTQAGHIENDARETSKRREHGSVQLRVGLWLTEISLWGGGSSCNGYIRRTDLGLFVV